MYSMKARANKQIVFPLTTLYICEYAFFFSSKANFLNFPTELHNRMKLYLEKP